MNPGRKRKRVTRPPAAAGSGKSDSPSEPSLSETDDSAVIEEISGRSDVKESSTLAEHPINGETSINQDQIQEAAASVEEGGTSATNQTADGETSATNQTAGPGANHAAEPGTVFATNQAARKSEASENLGVESEPGSHPLSSAPDNSPNGAPPDPLEATEASNRAAGKVEELSGSQPPSDRVEMASKGLGEAAARQDDANGEPLSAQVSEIEANTGRNESQAEVPVMEASSGEEASGGSLSGDSLSANDMPGDSTAGDGAARDGASEDGASEDGASEDGASTGEEFSKESIPGDTSPGDAYAEDDPAVKFDDESIPPLLRLPAGALQEEFRETLPRPIFSSSVGLAQSLGAFGPFDAEPWNVESDLLATSGLEAPEEAAYDIESLQTRARTEPARPSTAAESAEPAPALRFSFRAKTSAAPTPEEAAAQLDWLNAPSRSARIGRRSELGRMSPGRHTFRTGRVDDPFRPAESGVSSEQSVREIEPGWAGSELDIPDLTAEDADEVELDALVEGTGAGETAEDTEGRDDRGRPPRRRKDRNRGRRRDRNGAGDIADDLAAIGDTDEDGAASASFSPPSTSKPAAREMDEELQAEADALSRIGLDQRLGKEIFVSTGARETRIAYMVSGMLTELHIEREERLVGAVCKARVDRVLPGLDAAFVDISLERNAFLMAGDVVPEDDDDDSSHGRKSFRHASISDLVKPRQEIMVQVSKGPVGSKGARVSTRVSLPGRYLVLMPDSETVGVSRKIEEDSERDRLKKIARAHRPQGFGIIVRTEAENKTEEELSNDVQFLLRLWGQIQQKYRIAKAPSIVHRDLSLTFKIIRDLFGSDVNRFVIDSRDEYEKVIELVDFISPRLRPRVVLYEDPLPLFEYVGLESEIDRLFRHKVWLKSGGWLAIDETEALTTIDVNSGKNVGTTNPAQTIFKVNMESVVEICRQLRLRDIGGMIILDFIDMSNSRDRAAVMKALDVALKRDRSRTKIAHLSPLGLVEMTRKRSGETFSQVTTEPCSYCAGRGRTLNPDTVSILAEREIKKQALDMDDEGFLVMVNPAVAPFLVGPEAQNVRRIEQEIRRAVYVRAADTLHIEKFEVVPVDIQEMERQLLPFREGQVVDCVVEQTPAINLPHAMARLDGYLLDLTNGGQYLGRRVRARLVKVDRSSAVAEVIGGGRSVDKLGGL